MYIEQIYHFEDQEIEDLVFDVAYMTNRADFNPDPKTYRQRTDMFWVRIHEPAPDRRLGEKIGSAVIDPDWRNSDPEKQLKNFRISLQFHISDSNHRARLEKRIAEYFIKTAEYQQQCIWVRDHILAKLKSSNKEN